MNTDKIVYQVFRWFDPCWWDVLLEPRPTYYSDVTWLTVLWCRIRNHPQGIIYYTWGTEPDMHCKTCGDDLG